MSSTHKFHRNALIWRSFSSAFVANCLRDLQFWRLWLLQHSCKMLFSFFAVGTEIMIQIRTLMITNENRNKNRRIVLTISIWPLNFVVEASHNTCKMPSHRRGSLAAFSKPGQVLRVRLTDSSGRTGMVRTRESRIEASFYKMRTHGKSRRSWLWVKKTACWPPSMKRQVPGFPIFCFLWVDETVKVALGLCLNRAWTIPDCHSWSALKVFNGRDLAPVLLMNLYKTSEVFMKFPNCIIRVIIRNNLESWTIKRSLAFTIGLWPDFWNFAFNGHILLNSSVTTTTISQFYSSSMLA